MTRRRKTIVIILGVLVAVAIAARVLFGIYAPDIVRALVDKAVRDNTDARLELGEVTVEGLSTIALRDLRLTDPADGGREVLYVEKVEAALAGIPWTGGDVRLSKVRLERPRAMAVLERDPQTGERRTNFQRLLHPKPSERKTIVERLVVTGADLRILFPGMGETASPAAGGEPEDDEAQRDPLVELRNVDLALDLADEGTLSYEVSLRVGDEAWGPAVFDGIASARPLAIALSGTGGGIKFTAQTLATLPGVTPGMLARLQPEAELRLGSLRVSPGAKVTADVTLAGVGVSPPAMQRIEDAELTVQLTGRELNIRPRALPPVEVPGLGEVTDLAFTARLDLDTFELRLDDIGARLLGGRVAGDVTVPDLRAARPVPRGTLTFSGVGYHASGTPAALTAGGRIVFGPVALDGGHTGLRVALEETTADVRRTADPTPDGAGPPASDVTFEVPVEAVVTVDLESPPAPVAFQASVGGDAVPVKLDVAGRYDTASGVVEFDKSDGQVVLTSDTLAKMADLGPEAEAAHKAALAGTIRFGVNKGTRLPLRNPLAVTGVVWLQSDPLAFTLPGASEPGAARVVVSVTDDDADPRVPRLGFRTAVSVQRLDKPGLVQAHLLLDPEGRLVFASAELQRAEVSDAPLKALRGLGALPENLRAAIAALPEFKATLSGEVEAPVADSRPKQVRGHLTATFGGGPSTVVVDVIEYQPADTRASVILRARQVAITDGLVRTLRRALVAARPELAQPIDRALDHAQTFAMSVDGRLDATCDLATGKLSGLAGQGGTENLRATLHAGEGTDVALTGAVRGDFSLDGFDLGLRAETLGGRVDVQLRQNADGAALLLNPPPFGLERMGGVREDIAFRVEALPKALRDKVPQLVAGLIDVAAEAKAKTVSGLASAPVAFVATLQPGRIAVSSGDAGGEQRHLEVVARATGKLLPADRRIENLKVIVPILQGEAGSYLLGGRGTVTSERLDLDADEIAGTVALNDRSGKQAAGCAVKFSRKTGLLSLKDITVRLEGQDLMRPPGMPRGTEGDDLTFKGRLTVSGSAMLDTRGGLANGALYDLAAEMKDFAVYSMKANAFTAPLDAAASLRRKTAADAHNLTFATADPDYGGADVRAGYSPDRVTASATFEKFVLAPELLAVAGPLFQKIKACAPSGLLDGKVNAALVRDGAGAWKVAELGGELTGRNLSANCPTGDLKFSGGLLKAKLAPERITLETFEGTLADGQLKLSGDLLPTSPEGNWVVRGGKLSLVRAELRQFQGVAHRPPNELNGRLTVNMASQEAFGFAGPLTDPAKLTGRGHASFGEGHLWRLPLFQVLRSKLFEGVAALLRSKFDPTSFRKAEADFLVADGKLTFPEQGNAEGLSPASIDSDLVRMVIDGDVHFDGRMDLHVASGIRADLARGGGLGDLIPGLGKEWDRFKNILKQVPGGEIPIIFGFWHVTGTFDKPNPQPDAKRTLKKLFGSGLEFLKRKDEPAPAPGR